VDGQVRAIISALRARPNTLLTCEIVSATAATFHATSDSWVASVPVRLYVNEPAVPRRTQIDFHEVWWADVNEPYSLIKQLRFWAWSLSVWLYPGKVESVLPSASAVMPPTLPSRWRLLNQCWIRLRLLGVGFVAVLGAASIGLVTFLAERVLKLQYPDIVKTFVNYVAGVKLYNQKQRLGGGIPSKPDDFLDTIDEPPRVSIRRRMIRTLMTVAEEHYERWYVLAHSLGSVVAFNGLMETAYAWPGYFDLETWTRAKGGSSPFAGPAATAWPSPGPGDTLPRRPVWIPPREVAYRSQIFENLHGFLTFGCPLEKFAAIWPGRVPLSLEPAFRGGTEWLNVYDPTDPVSGVLKSFNGAPINCCPAPRNYGFASGPLLLLSHIQYLRASRTHTGLADGIGEWLLSGSSGRIGVGRGWFKPGSARHWARTGLAWVSWIFAVFLLAGAGALVLPPTWSVAREAECAIEHRLQTSGLRWVDTGCPRIPETTEPGTTGRSHA
jgi:hypothetical protein